MENMFDFQFEKKYFCLFLPSISDFKMVGHQSLYNMAWKMHNSWWDMLSLIINNCYLVFWGLNFVVTFYHYNCFVLNVIQTKSPRTITSQTDELWNRNTCSLQTARMWITEAYNLSGWGQVYGLAGECHINKDFFFTLLVKLTILYQDW